MSQTDTTQSAPMKPLDPRLAVIETTSLQPPHAALTIHSQLHQLQQQQMLDLPEIHTTPSSCPNTPSPSPSRRLSSDLTDSNISPTTSLLLNSASLRQSTNNSSVESVSPKSPESNGEAMGLYTMSPYDHTHEVSQSPFVRLKSRSEYVKRRGSKPITTAETSLLKPTDLKSPKRSQSVRNSPRSPGSLAKSRGHSIVAGSQSNPLVEGQPPVRNRSGSVGVATREQLDQWAPSSYNSRVISRFLQLPESDDYERQRNFSIERGCLVNRGDSFRRRSNTGKSSTAGSRTSDRHDSNGSVRSSRDPSPYQVSPEAINNPLPVTHFDVVVVGSEGTGKTALISQFMSSETSTPFALDFDGPQDNRVLLSLEGSDSEMYFIEVDHSLDSSWSTIGCDGYMVVYSVDSRVTFRNATDILSSLEELGDEKPVILVGNKIDLARKRMITTEEGKNLAKSHKCKFVEVSAPLSHNTDQLLVGMLAQIRQSFSREMHEYRSPSLTGVLNGVVHRGPQRQKSPTNCINISSMVECLLRRKNSKSCDNLFV